MKEQQDQIVVGYYDQHVTSKLRDFVDGNPRVECAWTTIEKWAPALPKNILEIGCGIGAICWRMKRRWPDARIVGLDISPQSVEIAKKLFGLQGLTFVEGSMTKDLLADKFDLIVLMDVYEHISSSDRPTLHDALKRVLDQFGRIVLSFPTPRHLSWLREHEPRQIQPIDEDVNIGTMLIVEEDLESEILLYQEVGVWHEGDYAHSVLGKRGEWVPVNNNCIDAYTIRQRIEHQIKRLVRAHHAPLEPSREERLSLVQERLGPTYYRSN